MNIDLCKLFDFHVACQNTGTDYLPGGGWADSEFESDGCGTGTCQGKRLHRSFSESYAYIFADWVQNNPSAFQDAYFDLNWVKVFQ